jgi:putative CocE/NonD family hydrolase
MAPPHGRDAWLTCRDGTRLISRIWQPGEGGPWPALLMRQPYGRAIASTPTYAHPAWYAARGFLVVVQDVRGQGDSEGNFRGFAQEGADTADTLRWVRSLPECNGRVGCYGFSYQGFTPLVSDDETAEGLPDCAAVAMTGLEERDHWACSGGAQWWALGLAWGLQLAALACRRRGDGQGWQAIRSSLSSGTFLHDGPALLERHDPHGMAWRWLRSDPQCDGDWLRHQANGLGDRPLLLVGGWHDPHLAGVLDLWRRCRSAGGRPLLRIGAWTHLNWQEGLDALQLAFFQRHLGTTVAPEAPGALEPAVRLQSARDGQWHDPAHCSGPRATWWLGGEGTLEPLAPGAGRQWLVHDPWRPVPGRGGHLGLDAGECERGDLDQRRDVACFTGTAGGEPLRLACQPRLQLRVSADQPGFDLCAALSRVLPDGRVQQLSTGVRRERGEHCLQNGWRTVELQPLLLELRPGERLRLSLAGAAWPQIAVNPGTGANGWGDSSADHRVITLCLDLEEARVELHPLNQERTDGVSGANWAELTPAS